MNIIDQLMHVALLGSEWVLYLLLLLSVASIGIMVERVWFFSRNRRGSQGLRGALTTALVERGAEGAHDVLRAHPSVEATVVAEALRFKAGGPPAVVEAVQAALSNERARLERGLTFLGTLGNNAPFIGLFGTVIGVVVAFHHLGDASDAAMNNVMAAIAEALIATGVGIFVALPAVIAFNVVQKRIADIEAEVHGIGNLLAAWLRAPEGVISPAEAVAPERREAPGALAGELE